MLRLAGCPYGLDVQRSRWVAPAAAIDDVLLVVGKAALSPQSGRSVRDVNPDPSDASRPIGRISVVTMTKMPSITAIAAPARPWVWSGAQVDRHRP
ncbi:hypothetical protein [Streptomyces huasconensis]|uniref:hypothetical protein n=1 Tax=Streptomyces huasconensis TaxID=1854574 RepID=UPI0033DB0083